MTFAPETTYFHFKFCYQNWYLHYKSLKSRFINDFNSSHLSNYFSGIVAFENNDNTKAVKFFESSQYLINQHNSYLENYVNTLVIEGRVQKAANEIKQNLTEDNSTFFEAHLGVLPGLLTLPYR